MTNKIANFLFVKTQVPKLEKYLDLSAKRHMLVSSNIANVSTPGYKSRDINFQEEFNKATQETSRLAGETTHRSHIPLGQHKDRAPEVIEAKVESGEMNSVNIDTEISNMAQNELLFAVGSRLLQRNFESLRKAITSK
jgi:flagellar basal-body rod protein FlgB